MCASKAAVSSAKDADRPDPPSSLMTASQLPLLRSRAVGGDVSCSSALLLHTPSNGWASARRVRSLMYGRGPLAHWMLWPNGDPTHPHDLTPRFVCSEDLLREQSRSLDDAVSAPVSADWEALRLPASDVVGPIVTTRPRLTALGE